MRIVATSQIRYHRTPTVIPEQQPGAGAFEPAQAPAKKIRLLNIAEEKSSFRALLFSRSIKWLKSPG